MKVLWAILGVLAFLGLVSTCGGSDEEKKTDSAKSSTAAEPTRPEPTPSKAPSPTPTGPQKPEGTSFTSTEGAAGQEITAKFAIPDNFTEGLIKDSGRFKTIDVLEYARDTYPNAAQVTVEGTFPMTDQYGNTETDVVINLTYSKSTLDKINFDGVDKDKIWELADSGYVVPAFRP